MAFDPLELSTTVVTAATQYGTGKDYALVDGERFRIQVKSGDVWTDLLDKKVPNNKAWTVRINLSITETTT